PPLPGRKGGPPGGLTAWASSPDSGDADRAALSDDHPMASEARNLLRHLAASDEDSLRTVLVPTPEFGGSDAPTPGALDRRTRALVRLAALFAIDAGTESLRWAVDLASAT